MNRDRGRPPLWLGLDIGGANLKAAHSSGQAQTLPFELWKRPGELSAMLAKLGALLPAADRVAVTMTAELCDCFETKAQGVASVLESVGEAFPGLPVIVWSNDGKFLDLDAAVGQPDRSAASNWLALATLAARLLPGGPGLLVDIGTTTTDLIPLIDGRPAARGRTDLQRLQTGELVYAGVRRTPVMALADELPIRGIPTALTAELFASTLDVYLTLGSIAPDPTDASTADGRPATVEAARDRLARMVGADRLEFSDEDAVELAEAADSALLDRLAGRAERACDASVGRPRGAVICGSGAFLARRLARRLVGEDGPVLDLDEVWGPLASRAGCAYAVVVLAGERADDEGAVPGSEGLQLAGEADSNESQSI